MANKNLFASAPGKRIPATNTVNAAGGRAYQFEPRQALAQYAATGCLNSTFYASAEAQLDTVLTLCQGVSPKFIAQAAVYAREHGHMKDLPALLLARLSAVDSKQLERVFDRVCDNARMVRNFVQIVRSGAAGRKSLGTVPKRLVQRWFDRRSDEQLFHASVGQSPSLADLVKMVHPRPSTPARAAFYGWLLGRKHDAAALPACVQAFERYKSERQGPTPDVPFQMLTALELGTVAWAEIARRASWQMTRMNLNTFARHSAFGEAGVTRAVAQRLRDHDEIRRARVFPYQLLMAHSQVDEKVPAEVRDALEAAMEIAIENVPSIPGGVVVCPDVSGSMQTPVTGYRVGATTAVRCVDVAALVAAAFRRKNADCKVLPFSDGVVPCALGRNDTVLRNAKKLASLPSGGTNCSAPLVALNKEHFQADLVVMVSDNMSWVDSAQGGRGTATMQAWAHYKVRNPLARLVCLDIQPGVSTQAEECADILNVGGFSDAVFEIIARFAQGELAPDHWVGEIEKIEV